MARRRRARRERHPGIRGTCPRSARGRRSRSRWSRIDEVSEVGATFKFGFELLRALSNDMNEAKGGKELVGVMDGSVVETQGKKKGIVQAFKVSSKLWVSHSRHKRSGSNAKRDPEQCVDLGQKNMYE